MQFTKRKILLASGFILVFVLLVAYFLLDPTFIESSSSSGGLGFYSLEKSASLRRELDEQGTPYAIKKNEDGEYATTGIYQLTKKTSFFQPYGKDDPNGCECIVSNYKTYEEVH